MESFLQMRVEHGSSRENGITRSVRRKNEPRRKTTEWNWISSVKREALGSEELGTTERKSSAGQSTNESFTTNQ